MLGNTLESGKEIQRALFLTNMILSNEKIISLRLQIPTEPELRRTSDTLSISETSELEDFLHKMYLDWLKPRRLPMLKQVTPLPPYDSLSSLIFPVSARVSVNSKTGRHVCQSSGKAGQGVQHVPGLGEASLQQRAPRCPHQPQYRPPRPFAKWEST